MYELADSLLVWIVNQENVPQPGVSSSNPLPAVSSSNPLPGVSSSNPQSGAASSYLLPGSTSLNPLHEAASSYTLPGVSSSTPLPGATSSNPRSNPSPGGISMNPLQFVCMQGETCSSQELDSARDFKSVFDLLNLEFAPTPILGLFCIEVHKYY